MSPFNKIPEVEKCLVKGLGTVYSASYNSYNNTFNNVSSVVLAEADELLGFRDLAYCKTLYGIDHSIGVGSLYLSSSYVNQRVVCIPGEKNNMYWLNLDKEKSKEFSQHIELSSGREPFLESKFDIKSYLSTLSEKECIPINNITDVNIADLVNDERMQWAFEDMVEPMREILYKNNLTKLPINMRSKEYINSQPKPFTNVLWFFGSFRDFAISCGGDYADKRIVRGLKRGIIEPPKFEVPSNLQEQNTDVNQFYF